MKILHVIPYFSPKLGGDVKVCSILSKYLVKRGHEVTIVTSDYLFDEAFAIDHEKEGIKIVKFNNTININLFLVSIGLNRWLKKEIKKFDVIHLHDLRSYQNAIAYYYAIKNRVPYCLQPDTDTPRIGKKWLKYLFDIVVGYKILKNANRIIAISNEEIKDDLEMGADIEKIRLIYLGMDLEPFNKLPEYGYFRNKYNINYNFILYIGRIHKTKGLDFAVKGFSQLLNEINDVKFIIAGHDDGYKSELIKLIKNLNLDNNIRFIDFLDEKDKISALVDANLFIHTVYYMGGVGIIPLEAVLCNTPVVVTHECGEIIEKANCGYIVDYMNIDQLKNTMLYVLTNQAEAKQLSINGKKFIINKLDWNNTVFEIEQVYKECCNNCM